jgi:co-chaperonin GroES (HSP10)
MSEAALGNKFRGLKERLASINTVEDPTRQGSLPKPINPEDVIKTFDLIPYTGRVFIIEDVLPEKVGSIYIPRDVVKEVVVTTGTVIAVGDDVSFCEKGDKVFYARYSGAKCTWKDREYRVMNEEDLLGKEKKYVSEATEDWSYDGCSESDEEGKE